MPEDVESTPSDASACDVPTAPRSALFEPDVETSAHFDLVIIGAGPAALAVISRILESRPAALYTEDEHRHLHFTHRQRTFPLIPSRATRPGPSSPADSPASLTARELEAQSRQGRKRRFRAIWNTAQPAEDCPCDGRIKILVVDRLGEGFMGLWRRNFKALGISHLRSPMFFHPDASDFDSLIAFANQHGRAAEGSPDQVIDLIEKRVAAGTSAATMRGKGAKRRSKSRKSQSSPDDGDQQGQQRRSSDDASLPDLIEILGVVGKEKSKHRKKQQHQQQASNRVHVNERDRRDYFTPSSALFDSFTRKLEQKYRVKPCGDECCDSTWPKVSQFFNEAGSVQGTDEQPENEIHGLEESPVTTLKGRVKEMAWFDGAQRTIQDDFGNHHPGFLMSLDDGPSASDEVVISTKAVVSAVGFGGMPAIPSYLTAPSPSPPPACGPGWMHSSCLANLPFPSAPLVPRPSHMVVVGGGLTSAQIVVRALQNGFDKVTLLVRGHLKSKPFDVDLGWVGRYSNYLKMQFWQNEDVQERLTMLRAARNGGSVTPTYAKVLARLQALGKLDIKTHTTIGSAQYATTASIERAAARAKAQAAAGAEEGDESEAESVEDVVDDGIASVAEEHGDRQWSLLLRSNPDTGAQPTPLLADYIVVATGAKIDFSALPFLSTLQRTHPTTLVGGMPVLTADLEYRRDVPLFVTGAYAGLQIGPAAGNLGGMRDSADRIANRLLELLALPEAVVPALEQVKEINHRVEQEGKKKSKSSTKARNEVGSNFTHFNFEMLSIEA